MSRPRTHEQRLLLPANDLLERAGAELRAAAGSRIEILEAVAARHGASWTLDEYRTAFPAQRTLESSQAALWADKLLDVLTGLNIPLALSVAALARPDLAADAQRKTGAYYTDYRLGRYLAAQFDPAFTAEDRVIDLACGSGMLLAALSLAAGSGDPNRTNAFISHSLCAADLHPTALQATRATLAVLAQDLDALNALEPRLLAGDSLTRDTTEWEALAPGGFAAVIGNPPWEKLKVSRHELLRAGGALRHYGADYEQLDWHAYDGERRRMLTYVEALSAANRLQGKGEADLYKLFLELGSRLLRPGGQLGLLLPAGLIRSQGTHSLREFLVDHAPRLHITVMENRASFFAIDTRFKFLSVHASLGVTQAPRPLMLKHAQGTSTGVKETDPVRIERENLRELRPDLTIPEVRTGDELRLFQQLVERGSTLNDPQWSHSYMREVDMTNDRAAFSNRGGSGFLPLLEGRVVHQHRTMAKAHVSGSGRAAVWRPLVPERARLAPQYWYPRVALSDVQRRRADSVRAGFCDVTGQTNERTLLAAVVPAGVVCGNKVPTLAFEPPGIDSEDAALLWVAIANSFPVDWAARRVVTTSMNYFLLRSLPLPRVEDVASRDTLLESARALWRAEGSNAYDGWEMGLVRAQVDAIVAGLFGLTVEDLAVMLDDFRLPDRGQPPLPREARSTVTRDVVLAAHAARLGQNDHVWEERAERARQLGAVPYVPADYVGLTGR